MHGTLLKMLNGQIGKIPKALPAVNKRRDCLF